MPDALTTAVAPAATTVAPETPAEQTFDQQLDALLDKKKGDTPLGEEVVTPAETPATPDINAQLDAIEEPKIDAPVAPTLTPEQQRVFAMIPNEEAAKQAVGLANSYTNFTGAFERGDFDAVEGMFQAWKPEVYEQFLEHIYKTRGDSMVDRWLADKEGNPNTNRALTAMQKELQSVKAQLAQRGQQEQTVQQQRAAQQAFSAYTSHIEGLFDKIQFSRADRRWVMNDINARVGADPNIRAAIGSGNAGAVNGIFKTAVREYVDRDKQVTENADAMRAAQSKHVAPLQSAPTVEGGLPADIKQVPKGKEDDWLDQQLASHAASRKRR